MRSLKDYVRRVFRVRPEGGVYKYASFWNGEGEIVESKSYIGINFYKMQVFIGVSLFRPKEWPNQSLKPTIFFTVKSNKPLEDSSQYRYLRCLIMNMLKQLQGFRVFFYSEIQLSPENVILVKSAGDFLQKIEKAS